LCVYEWQDEEKRYCEKRNSSGINEHASAEVSSLIKYAQNHKEDLEVILFASDTLLSHVIATTLADAVSGFKVDGLYEITIYYNPDQDYLKGMQIKDIKAFQKEGIRHLVNRYLDIKSSCYKAPAINITGGYKGLIPMLAILGQIYGCTIFYMFENTDVIIEIPKLPVQMDENIFMKYFETFLALDENFITERDHYEFCNDEIIQSMIDTDDGEVSLNPLGYIFWERFKDKCVIYYMPDDVWKNLEDHKCRKLKKMLAGDPEGFETEAEQNGHVVFKKGHEEDRAYRFKFEGKWYLYKVFGEGEHDKCHIPYMKKTPFTEKLKRDTIKNSKPRIIFKEER